MSKSTKKTTKTRTTGTTSAARSWLLRGLDATESVAVVTITAGEREAARGQGGPAMARIEVPLSVWSRLDLLRLAALLRTVANHPVLGSKGCSR